MQTDEFGRISQGILLLSPQAHQGQAKLQEQFLSAVNQPVSSLFEEQQPTEVQITSSYSQMQYGSNLPTLLSVDSSFAEPPLPSSSNSSYSCTPRLLKLKRFRCPPTAINNDGCKGTSSSSGNSGDMGDGGEGESGRWVYVCSHGGLVYIRLVADQFVNFVKQQSYSNDIARPLPPPSDRFSQSLLITSFGMIDHV